MLITVKREQFLPRCTIGRLFIDGVYECYTLEDAVRETADPVERWKIPGETAIPRGLYPVTLTLSHRFKKVLPLLGNVRGFSGVRIHSGNTHEDTEGCILVGASRLPASVGNSRIAFARMFAKLQAAAEKKELINLVIEGDKP